MQLLPPIGRLCEPIQSMSLADIARSLGLDAAKYEARYTALTGDQDRLNFESYYTAAGGANDDEAFAVRVCVRVRVRACKRHSKAAAVVLAA